MSTAGVVVFTWGNPSRGDDGVGPWFADRFRNRAGSQFTLVEDFQLQVEHLLDCHAGQLLLFIDACYSAQENYQFAEVQIVDSVAHTSHALTPAELLSHYRRVFKEQAPPAFQLSIPGAEFELGQGMSAATLGCCERAVDLVETLLAAPTPGDWRRLTCHRESAPWPLSSGPGR